MHMNQNLAGISKSNSPGL